MRILALLLVMILASCAPYSPRSSTISIDYFGVREATWGPGWDNPLNVERLFLAEVEPLVVMFGTVGETNTESLIRKLVLSKWKEKVWILDNKHPVSSMLQALMDVDAKESNKLVLVYRNGEHSHIITGKDLIIDFFEAHGFALLKISDKYYY